MSYIAPSNFLPSIILYLLMRDIYTVPITTEKTIFINGQKYDSAMLSSLVLSGAVIDFPETFDDSGNAVNGEHHGFVQRDGVLVRIVVGKHSTSRKARLISKILLKKALFVLPVAQPNDWKPYQAERNTNYHNNDRNRFVPRDQGYYYPDDDRRW